MARDVSPDPAQSPARSPGAPGWTAGMRPNPDALEIECCSVSGLLRAAERRHEEIVVLLRTEAGEEWVVELTPGHAARITSGGRPVEGDPDRLLRSAGGHLSAWRRTVPHPAADRLRADLTAMVRGALGAHGEAVVAAIEAAVDRAAIERVVTALDHLAPHPFIAARRARLGPLLQRRLDAG